MDTLPYDSPGDSGALMANLVWTRGLAKSLVRGSEQAEELVQETWWRVLRNPAPDGVPERSWIAGVMRRVASDTARSASRRKRREEAFARSRPEFIDERHDQALLVHKDLVERVMELDAPLRRVVLLRYFDGRALREIAASEGLQVSGVRSRLERAHERLRSRLREHPESPAGALLVLTKKSAAAAAPVSALAIPFALLAMKTLVAAAGLALLTLVGVRLIDSSETDLESVRAEQPAVETGAPATPLALPAAGNVVKESVELTAEPLAVIEAEPASEVVAEASAGPRLEVRVVDDFGRPVADAPLMLAPVASSIGWSGRTDGEGHASVDQAWLVKAADSPWADQHQISIKAPGDGAGVVALDINNLPEDPVELVLSKARGSMNVEFVDPLGNVVSDVRMCFLSPVRTFEGINEVEIHRRGEQTSFTFEMLPLGERFEVGALVMPPFTVAEKVHPGPTQAGEVVNLRVKLAATLPTVSGRFLLPEAPTPTGMYATAYATIAGDEENRISVTVQLKEDMTFRGSVWPLGLEGQGCIYSFLLTKFIKGETPQTFLAKAEGILPKAGEIVELGELQPEARLPVVAGKVVDQEGEPIAGARVRFRDLQDGGPRRGTSSFDGGVLSGKDGRFEMLDYPGQGDFGLLASARKYAPATSDVVRSGDLEVRIVLAPALRLEGQIIPAENLSAESLYLFLHQGGELRPGSGGAQPDWSFSFNELQQSTCRLNISARNGTTDFLVIDDLMPVQAGQPADVRLGSIDLRGVVRAFQLRAQGADGTSIDEFSGRSGDTWTSASAGVMDAVVDRSLEWLTVGAPGYRPVDLRLDDLPETVVLERGLAVELVIPEGWPIGISRSQLRLKLVTKDIELVNPLPAGVAPESSLGESNRLRMVVPGPGKYLLYWTGTTPAGRYLNDGPYTDGISVKRIEVLETPELQVFHLSVE